MFRSGESSPKPKPLTPPTSQHQQNNASSYSQHVTTPPPSSPRGCVQSLTALGYSDEEIGAILTLSGYKGYDLNNVEKRGGIDDTDAYDSFKKQGTITSLEDDDPKGKKKLDEEDDDDDQRNAPLVEIDFLANFNNNNNGNYSDDANSETETESDVDANVIVAYNRRFDHDEYDRQQRKQQAAGFARPKKNDAPLLPLPLELEFMASPNPFSTAMKAIQERIKKRTKKNCLVPEPITWASTRNDELFSERFSVPSLLQLSLEILANHADAIASLDGVAQELRHGLSRLLCDSKRLNGHFVRLLLRGSPTEIRLQDCSWMTEEQFSDYFQTCDTTRLEVIQLDLCGQCLSDYTLLATLAQSPSYLPRLISLSLRGAGRLTDKGLHELVSCTPVLRSINLSHCSLLTYASLNTLADSLGSLLKELYLDDCLHIDAALIVPPLKRLEHLEVLSLAGLQSVSDKFIKDYIITCGHNMKELVLTDCIKLTDISMKVIAEHCPGLHSLDLSNLCQLTDLSIGYLTNGCQELHTLKLCRTPFSDEAIAAFLETIGESLTELSLNHITKVGQQTTLSLASHAKNLHTLDLSWCRILTDNEFGLIVDSCSSLRLLKIFGCSEVTDVFLKGHSNPGIQIIGSKLSPLLPHVKVAPLEALRYSSVSVDFDLN